MPGYFHTSRAGLKASEVREGRKRSRKQIPAFGKGHAYGGQASSVLLRRMTGAGGGGKSKEPAGCRRYERRRQQQRQDAGGANERAALSKELLDVGLVE
jgi:hypothetical protein